MSHPVLSGELYCCYRCQSLLVTAGSTLGTMAKTVEWFSAMVAMDVVYICIIFECGIVELWGVYYDDC